MRTHFSATLLLIIFFALTTFSLAEEPKLNHGLTYDEDSKIDISAYLASEKLDGVRAYWDGKQLLSKSGKPIHCPKWFSKDLPKRKLDGELWIKRNSFQKILSTVRKEIPIDSEWKNIKYMLFELPKAEGSFKKRYEEIVKLVNKANLPYLQAIKQVQLQNEKELSKMLNDITGKGGEGVILHLAISPFNAGRTSHILKVKKYYDDEAEVLEHITGKGKYEKVLGSMRVKNTKGKIFKIGTGFSDNERSQPPPIGSIITYKYYGFTTNGIPRFASFMRTRKEL